MEGAECYKFVEISDEDKVLLSLCHYYNIAPHDIRNYTTGSLSTMYSTMKYNKTVDRLHRMEEISVPYMEKKNKDNFLETLFKDMGEKYKEPHMVEEDELKRIFGGR